MLQVEAEGEGRLAQLLDLIYLGDWTSYYLALDNDVDPGPIDAISQLKVTPRAAEHGSWSQVGPRAVTR